MECKKRAYTTPEIRIYPMQEDYLLQAVSGQHKHIGQGGTFGNAKRGSDEEWEEASPNPSKGGELQACGLIMDYELRIKTNENEKIGKGRHAAHGGSTVCSLRQ